jgi:hypothetical protein
MVIRFPEPDRVLRGARLIPGKAESATVIILPVIRIEHYTDEPSDPATGRNSRRGRRRPASRS